MEACLDHQFIASITARTRNQSPEIAITQLTRITNRSGKTIVNHLTELKKLNLAIARGKTNDLYPTKLGELIARRRSFEKPRLPGSSGTELSK